VNRLERYFGETNDQDARELAMDIIRFCLVMYRIHSEAGELDCARSLAELEQKAVAYLLAP
jgi:hypothetical protein